MRGAVLGVAIFGVLGCTVPDVDLTGRACPCAPGWSCVADVCVQGVADAALDATRDGPLLDPTGCDDVHAGRIFCDGFESGAGFPEWDGASMEGTLALVDLAATGTYRGAGSLRTHTGQAAERAYLNKEALGTFTSGDIYLRSYMFVASTPALTHVVTMFLIDDAGDGVSLELFSDGRFEIYLARDDTSHAANAVIPFDQWICVEMHVSIGVGGSVSLAWDGVERASGNGIDTSTASGYSSFTVGLNWTDDTNSAGSTILYDDVVFDTAPIGCD